MVRDFEDDLCRMRAGFVVLVLLSGLMVFDGLNVWSALELCSSGMPSEVEWRDMANG